MGKGPKLTAPSTNKAKNTRESLLLHPAIKKSAWRHFVQTFPKLQRLSIAKYSSGEDAAWSGIWYKVCSVAALRSSISECRSMWSTSTTELPQLGLFDGRQ